MPDELLRAVAAIRAPIACARARDLAQSLADPLDRSAPVLFGHGLQFLAVHEAREHRVAENEALDARVERVRAREIGDDRGVREIAAQRRVRGDPVLDLRIEIRQLVDRSVALDERRQHLGDERALLLDDLLVERDGLRDLALSLRDAGTYQSAA